MSRSSEQGGTSKMYTVHELATLLVKDQGLHEGHYEFSVEIQIAVGAVGPNPQESLPGVAVGFKSATLRKVDEPNPLSVDASIVNPAPASKLRKTGRAKEA